MTEPITNTRSTLRAIPGMPVPCALEAQGLTVVRGRQVVLRDVDLAIAPGQIVAIFGSNGAGKTTLLHCLAGLLRPANGQVHWFGEAATYPSAARRLIGFLCHETGLYPALTARENLLFAGRMCGVDQPADRAAELLSAVGLQRYARQRPGCLSRGMRQRLAVARAVFHDPPILLLDEPFTSLDPDGHNWLAQFLDTARTNDRAIVIASHDEEQSRWLADRHLRLHAGRWHASNLGAGRQSVHPGPGSRRV